MGERWKGANIEEQRWRSNDWSAMMRRRCLGAVLPEHRSKGIARLLLHKMEVWCKLKGYKVLKFKTMNRHRNMLKFAINEGFNIVDFEPYADQRLSRIYFEKKI